MKNIFRLVRCGGFLLVLFSLFTTTNQLQAQWIQTNGPYVGDVTSFAVSGTNLFAGTSNFAAEACGVYLSTDNGTNWIATLIQDTIVSALVISGANLFAGTPHGILLSTNNGTSWTDLHVAFSNNNVHAFAVSGIDLFAGTYGGGINRSTNNGASWTAVNNGLTDRFVISLVANGVHQIAGTFSSGVFLSTNNGTSWTPVNNGLTGNHVPSLVDAGTSLFAGTNDGVFMSTNDTSWTAVGLQDTLVSSLAISGTNLFAGTSDILGNSGSVFLSTNNGINWTAANSGLPNTGILALTVSDANLFVGTVDSGVWRRPLSEMITGINDNEKVLPSGYLLGQNYPNPFNPGTSISFTIPSRLFVSLKLFDILGREVSVLASEELSPGNYTRKWNADGLPSGVYIYRLQAGTFSEIKKLILVR